MVVELPKSALAALQECVDCNVLRELLFADHPHSQCGDFTEVIERFAWCDIDPEGEDDALDEQGFAYLLGQPEAPLAIALVNHAGQLVSVREREVATGLHAAVNRLRRQEQDYGECVVVRLLTGALTAATRRGGRLDWFSPVTADPQMPHLTVYRAAPIVERARLELRALQADLGRRRVDDNLEADDVGF